MRALAIVGTTVAGAGVGWAAGMGLAMRDMDLSSIVYPIAGIIIGGFAGVVVGAVVFA